MDIFFILTEIIVTLLIFVYVKRSVQSRTGISKTMLIGSDSKEIKEKLHQIAVDCYRYGKMDFYEPFNFKLTVEKKNLEIVKTIAETDYTQVCFSKDSDVTRDKAFTENGAIALGSIMLWILVNCVLGIILYCVYIYSLLHYV